MSRKTNDIKTNDGGGLYDSIGLIDTIIVDCNSLVRCAVSGQYVEACAMVVQMVQKLGNLRTGVRADMAGMQDKIDELQKLLKDGGKDVVD